MSGRWLAGAMGVALVAAAVCAYATLALLFYQGQWQLVLHPTRTISATPHAKFDEVRFDATETGVTQLDGWWIPVGAGSRWSAATVLYLHGGAGSLSNCVDDLDALHGLGVNVFAFDYRGYGKSGGPHPDERRMGEDADAAWSYLTGMRNLNSNTIVIYGTGVGATLAAKLAARHDPAGVVLDAPNEPGKQIVETDARARMLPMWLLLDQRFDPSEALASSAVPKLFLDRNPTQPRTLQLYRQSASPKDYFEVKLNTYQQVLLRFLDGLNLR
jgi:pimeloyl-ACP methyl ester carboxylesterase